MATPQPPPRLLAGCRWHQAPMMPGAQRLLSHLQAHGVPLALATSTSRATLQRKLSTRQHVHEAFVATCCGDEVRAWEQRLARRLPQPTRSGLWGGGAVLACYALQTAGGCITLGQKGPKRPKTERRRRTLAQPTAPACPSEQHISLSLKEAPPPANISSAYRCHGHI